MSLSPDVIRTINQLPLKMESPHFIIHYTMRNPALGPGGGAHGVRDRVLILTYLAALESLFLTMTSPPWNRPRPQTVGENKKTHVYVCNVTSPFTAPDPHKIPCIVLSSRSNETTTHAELYRASAEAVHEATHLFNYAERPHLETSSHPWLWFDEGMAVLMETVVAAGNHDHFRYLMNWIDTPEMPLDAPGGKYQAGMFVRYLSKKLGADFVNDVWTKSPVKMGPLEALDHFAAQRGLAFASALPHVDDIFASGYCLDPYFLWEPMSLSLAPEIFVRYGERAISECFVMQPGDKITKPRGERSEPLLYHLDHLSCRYYRFHLRGGVSQLNISVVPEEPCESSPLKAEAVVVNADRLRTPTVTLQRPAANANGAGGLSAVVPTPKADEVDHVVLVVSNCGMASMLNAAGTGHDDNKRFTLTVEAV
jgi:hypothetical protein